MAGYLQSNAFVGPDPQGKLLTSFAVARGGPFPTVKVSKHTRTAAELIERFTGTHIDLIADEGHVVRIARP